MSDWRLPNGKFLEECQPNDIRALDDRSLVKLQRFLHDERACHRKDWLEADRRWVHLGLLEFVTRLGVQDRGLELGRHDRLRFPR